MHPYLREFVYILIFYRAFAIFTSDIKNFSHILQENIPYFSSFPHFTQKSAFTGLNNEDMEKNFQGIKSYFNSLYTMVHSKIQCHPKPAKKNGKNFSKMCFFHFFQNFCRFFLQVFKIFIFFKRTYHNASLPMRVCLYMHY